MDQIQKLWVHSTLLKFAYYKWSNTLLHYVMQHKNIKRIVYEAYRGSLKPVWDKRYEVLYAQQNIFEELEKTERYLYLKKHNFKIRPLCRHNSLSMSIISLYTVCLTGNLSLSRTHTYKHTQSYMHVYDLFRHIFLSLPCSSTHLSYVQCL